MNWNWSNIHERLSMVADTGCMWVKFQLFTKDMVPERFHEIAMEPTDISEIKAVCWDYGLSPIFTPMYPKAVAWCGSDHIKIRFKDRYNYNIIRLAEQKARNVWVSGTNVFCVDKYPATREDYGLKEDSQIHRPMGLSSHCPDIELAQLFDSKYIEYHVKFSEDDYEAAWSIGMDDLKKLVDWSNK